MSVDILGTSWDQCRSMVQYSFTSMETRRLVRTDSPGRPPRLSHSSWTMKWRRFTTATYCFYSRHFPWNWESPVITSYWLQVYKMSPPPTPPYFFEVPHSGTAKTFHPPCTHPNPTPKQFLNLTSCIFSGFVCWGWCSLTTTPTNSLSLSPLR